MVFSRNKNSKYHKYLNLKMIKVYKDKNVKLIFIFYSLYLLLYNINPILATKNICGMSNITL